MKKKKIFKFVIIFAFFLSAINVKADTGAFLGIEWKDTDYRYHWIEMSQDILIDNIDGNKVFKSSETAANGLNYLLHYNIFMIHTHSEQTTLDFNSMYTYNGQKYENPTYIDIYDIDSLPANSFSQLNLAFLGTCSAGEGRESANNLVNSIANKGAKIVIGFENITYVNQINQYMYDFSKSLFQNKNTYSKAMSDGLFYAKFWNYGNAGGTDAPYTRGNLNSKYPFTQYK